MVHWCYMSKKHLALMMFDYGETPPIKRVFLEFKDNLISTIVMPFGRFYPKNQAMSSRKMCISAHKHPAIQFSSDSVAFHYALLSRPFLKLIYSSF